MRYNSISINTDVADAEARPNSGMSEIQDDGQDGMVGGPSSLEMGRQLSIRDIQHSNNGYATLHKSEITVYCLQTPLMKCVRE
jgi:hypothetical protein